MSPQWKKLSYVGGFFLVLMTAAIPAEATLFSLDNYNQDPTHWIPSTRADYDKSLLTPEIQQSNLDNLYKHYYGTLSPWSADYVSAILNTKDSDDILHAEQTVLNELSLTNGYDNQQVPYTSDWFSRLTENARLEQFENTSYQANNRAMAIDNIEARQLPTSDIFLSHDTTNGKIEDRLQFTAIWAGTPLYILGESRDHAWSFVLTPSDMAWVKTNSIARVNPSYIRIWQSAAKNHLVAITQTDTSIVDNNNKFRFVAYIGSVFPGEETKSGINILIPVVDETRSAITGSAFVSTRNASMMPLTLTPHNMSNLLRSLIGRRYAKGGASFYNDDALELQNLLMPFGISLPQEPTTNASTNLAELTPEQRIRYLKENGMAFLSWVTTEHQQFLYLGNFINAANETLPMTYQNCRGINTNDGFIHLIGRSVFLPLLLQYPEDPLLMSQANTSSFRVTRIDSVSNNNAIPKIKSLINR